MVRGGCFRDWVKGKGFLEDTPKKKMVGLSRRTKEEVGTASYEKATTEMRDWDSLVDLAFLEGWDTLNEADAGVEVSRAKRHIVGGSLEPSLRWVSGRCPLLKSLAEWT